MLENTSSSSQKGRIFISYRRIDSEAWAGRIYDRLAPHFSDGAIFMDVDDIPAGVDFVKYLENEVRSCDVLIALIGEQWLNVKDEHGIRRLDNPNDFVRIEIATALKRDIRVIPVLLSGTQMPNVSDLPKNLQPLTRRNSLRVYHHSFHADTNRLIKHLEAALGAAEKDAQAKSEKEAAEKARLQAEAEEEERQRIVKEKAEREAVEKAAREKAEKEESEKARLEAEELARQEVAQKSIREKLLSVIVKKIAREKAEDVTQKALLRIEELLANAKAAREKYEREAAEKIAREKVEKQTAEKARDIDSITGKKIIDKPVSLCFYKAKIDQTYVSYERPASNVVIEVTTKTYKDFEPVKIVVDSKRYNRAQFFSKFSGGYGCLVSLLLPVMGIMLTVGIYYFFSDAPKNTFCALFLPTVFWSLGLYFLKYKKELATPEKILLRKYIDTLWMNFGIKKDEVLFTEEEYKDVRLSNKTTSKRSV